MTWSAPDRPSSWRTFLRSHWGEIAATDLFTTEVWTPRGLRTYYVLFFIELKTRRVHLSSPTLNPTDWFMGTATEAALPFLKRCRFMIHDRDSKYSPRFRILMENAGIKTIRTPKLAPNANAFAERFVRTIKDECLNRMIFFGEKHVQRALDEFSAHYHTERNHQGIGNELIEEAPSSAGDIVCDERLGGLLKHYRRTA